LDLASRRQGKPVRPVWQTSQTDFVQNLPKDPKHIKSLSTSKPKKPWHNKDFLAQKPFSTAHRAKPVTPVFAWIVGKNTARGKNSTLPPIGLPIHSTDQSETLGIVGVPHGLPLSRSSVHKTHSIKRNRKSTLTNTSNPRTPKHTEIEPLNSWICEGNHSPKNHEGFLQISPHQIPKTKVPKTTQENHQERAL
jgi:hypothetical protein